MKRIKAWLKRGGEIIDGLGTEEDPAFELLNGEKALMYGVMILCTVMLIAALIGLIIEKVT